MRKRVRTGCANGREASVSPLSRLGAAHWPALAGGITQMSRGTNVHQIRRLHNLDLRTSPLHHLPLFREKPTEHF